MNKETQSHLEIAIKNDKVVPFLTDYTTAIRLSEPTEEEIDYYHACCKKYIHYYGKEYNSYKMAAEDFIQYINSTVTKLERN